MSVAVALAQIGEFSFILANAGRNLGVLGESGANALVGAAIISISLNPLLYRLIDPLDSRYKHSSLWRMFQRRAKQSAGQQVCGTLDTIQSSQDRAVVVGYGPTGSTVARLLRENVLNR